VSRARDGFLQGTRMKDHDAMTIRLSPDQPPGPSPDGLLMEGRRIGATIARMMSDVTASCPAAQIGVKVETLHVRVTPNGEVYVQPAEQSEAWMGPSRLTLLAGVLAGIADTARLLADAANEEDVG
jgi:hypothetical protein